jgi:hypothetical protein
MADRSAEADRLPQPNKLSTIDPFDYAEIGAPCRAVGF